MRERDPLSDLFARVDPARTSPTAPLTSEQLAVRERITRQTARAPRHRLRVWGWASAIVLPVAAALIAVALVTSNVFSAPPAAAYGPRPLTVRPIDESTADAVDRLIATAASRPPVDDVRGATFDEWALEISDIGTPQESVDVQASVTELSWKPDGSGERLLVAGVPFYADGAEGIPADPRYTAGDVISTQTYAPGEFTPSLPDLSILNLPDADALAQFGLTTRSSAGDFALLLPAVLSEWRPSPRHEARLLHLISSLEGLTLSGTTSDRLGRPALAFVATSPEHPHRAWTVLLSPEDGRFLGLEESTVGNDRDLDVPPDTVIQYDAWH